MAVKVLDRDTGKGCDCITVYLCDTAEDVETLSTETEIGVCGALCSAGSMAIVVEPKGLYVLNNQGEWKLWS